VLAINIILDFNHFTAAPTIKIVTAFIETFALIKFFDSLIANFLLIDIYLMNRKTCLALILNS
jgi:hypothetical protein